MSVPTSSPLRARVRLPGVRPLMTRIARRFLACSIISRTGRSTTTSCRSRAFSSATEMVLINLACRSFFVLDIDHRLGAKHLTDQVGPGISAVGRDAADGGILVPEGVGWHAKED